MYTFWSNLICLHMYVKKLYYGHLPFTFPNSSKKYTNLEGDNLIGYISQHERYKHVRAQHFWKEMEKRVSW